MFYRRGRKDLDGDGAEPRVRRRGAARRAGAAPGAEDPQEELGLGHRKLER